MHSILFDNAQSDENEALPLGNGVFGGMVYFNDNKFTIPFNHYEVYYTIHSRYSNSYKQKLERGEISTSDTELSYDEIVEAAISKERDYTKESYLNYRKIIWPQADVLRDAGLHRGASQAPTGELSLTLADCFKNADDYSLKLDIEGANTLLYSKNDGACVSVQTTILSDCDACLLTVSQDNPNSVKELNLKYPLRRNHDGFTSNFHVKDNSTFYYTVSFFPESEDREKYEPFHFIVMTKLVGAKGEGRICEDGINIRIVEDSSEYNIITYVLTELKSDNLECDVSSRLDEVAENLESHLAAHSQHWAEYFSKSKINIPDKFLEKLWYLNLYVLNCSSGKDGVRAEQACGLNGLWDIKQPTIWGSLWYWDVNIQAAHWGVYTSNHMELASVFNDGFLSYADMAHRRAKEIYHAKGYAIDYPHTFYNCIFPWCAQHLWWYYEYTLDVEFLKHRAYPMFKGQIEFIRDAVPFDKERDEYCFFPDVSPEQGPIGRNSIITVSTVRYLLEMAIKANEIIGGDISDRELFEGVLSKLPAYPTVTIDRYGEVFRDSELAPPGIKLRHPSMLMPIFPIGEINAHSEESIRKIAENTLRFVSKNTEIGVFPFGWIASAAARLSMGNTALRVLYEQGLDCILRANGMGSETTERYVNHCLVDLDFGQIYSPYMMECVGEVVCCVNEMLLQSYDGIITVFPAIPNGDEESWVRAYEQENLVEPSKKKDSVVWEECSFDSMLAKGGFLVSAKLEGAVVVSVKIKSLYASKVSLRMPIGMDKPIVACGNGGAVASDIDKDIISFETTAGMEYFVTMQGENYKEFVSGEESDVFNYPSHLGRRVFAGKDKNTDTIRRLDSFMFDYYVGNDRYKTIAPYKFNFGLPKDELACNIVKQCYQPQNDIERRFIKITPTVINCTSLGFGFGKEDCVTAIDTMRTNELLRDCIFGYESASFAVELPKGRYDILIISNGGATAHTKVTIGSSSAILSGKDGRYCSEILTLENKRDGEAILQIATQKGYSWNINLMVIKKISAVI